MQREEKSKASWRKGTNWLEWKMSESHGVVAVQAGLRLLSSNSFSFLEIKKNRGRDHSELRI